MVLFENEKYEEINETGKELKKRINKEGIDRIVEKAMHGNFFCFLGT